MICLGIKMQACLICASKTKNPSKTQKFTKKKRRMTLSAAEKMAESLLIRASVEVALQKIITAATKDINLMFGPPDHHQEEENEGFCCLIDMMKNLCSRSSDEEISNLVKAMEELEKLKVCLRTVQAVQVDKTAAGSETILPWLLKLRDLASDADDALANFGYEILQYHVQIINQANKDNVGLSSSKEFRQEMLPDQVKDIISKLEAINKEVEGFPIPGEFTVDPSSQAVDPSNEEINFLISDQMTLVGIDEDTLKIVEMLTTSSQNEVLSVFTIVGTTGIGKTTLAQCVCQDKQVMKYFDRIIWVDVSGGFKIKELLKLISESLTQHVVGDKSIKDMVKHLKEELQKDRFLLVLDDILNVKPDKWEKFQHKLVEIPNLIRGNAVLVIVPNEKDAANISAVTSHSMAKLSPEHCLSIIKEKAETQGGTETETETLLLENRGRQIADKCQGLPLAANLLGGLLRGGGKGRQLWSSILESGILDSDKNILLQILRLIFEYLPSPFLQRCFAFASILPRNSVMERLQLVQLWMAQGFLDPEMFSSSHTMEEVGNLYFDILLCFSLFQPVTKDKYNKITHCKMHKLVHDFASSISRFEVIISCDASPKNEANALQVRHLSLEAMDKRYAKIVEEKGRHLQTLFLKSKIPANISLDVKSLHVLNLSGADIKELPYFIEELTQLEYLDVSRTKIKFLPDSICSLYNLQTLRISECNSLKGFPENFKNLLSLRHLHLYYDEYFHMPWEIGCLTNLQTLPIYNVGETMGPRIGELNSLKYLQGKLEIRNLDLVRNKIEAEQADLFGKSSLQELQLHWIHIYRPDPNDENVLDGLQPHPNLRSLFIKYFMGSRLPSWLMNMSVCGSPGGSPARLNNLMEVKLINCHNLQEIPTLGLLPLLRDLELRHLWFLTCIGPSFYDGNHSKVSEDDSQTKKEYFPALRSLTLHGLDSLKDWMGVEEISATNQVQVFPRLERLFIRQCLKLTNAPTQFPSLKELIIETVNSSSPLENICSKSTSLTELQILDVDDLTCLPDGLLQNNPYLARLHIENCHSLTHIVSDESCCGAAAGASIRELVIRNCSSLQELPEDLLESLQSLEKMEIF